MKTQHERKMRILADLAGTGRALDAGCSAMPNPFLKDAVGVDLVPPVEKPANYREIRLCDLNADALPFPDGSFDVVVAGDFIEHLENPSHFLREANRVLAPGGRLVLCTPQANDWWVTLHNWFFRRVINDPDPGEHLQNWTILDMKRLLRRSGFATEKVEGLYFQTPFVPIRIRMRRFPQFAWQAIYVAKKTGAPDRAVLVKDGADRKRFETNAASSGDPSLKIPCSVPILTLNNRATLERLLPVLVASFDDVFIVDGNSTDGTAEYARSLGVRVERQSDDPTPNLRVTHFANARKHSWALAKHDWIYWIDSDEVPTPELIDAVRRTVRENDPASIHQFVRVASLPDGRLVRHAFFYPEYVPRLFRRDSGVALVDRPVHERFIVPDGVRTVRHPETFVAPWAEPAALWKKHLGYLELDRLKLAGDWSALFRWVIAYNFRSLVGQIVRAARSSIVGAVRGETALPWSYNVLFFKYRLMAMRNGVRDWLAARRRSGGSGEFRAFLKRNALFFACAFVVGAVSVAPHLIHAWTIGDAYRGIPFFPLDDEDFYLARVREILDGHWAVGSHYYYEYKNFPSAYPPIGEFVFYAFPVWLFRIPLIPLYLISTAVYPAMLFLLVATFVRRLIETNASVRNSLLTPIAAGVLITIGYDLLHAGSTVELIRGTNVFTSNVWTRPVNPIAGGIFLFTTLHLALSLIRTHRRTAIAGIGVLVGLSAFYFFSWGISFAILSVLAIAYALLGEKRVRNDLLAALAIAAAVSAAVLWSTIRSMFLHESVGSGAARIGAIYTHAPVWSLTIVAAFAVFAVLTLLLWLRNRRNGLNLIMREEWWIVVAALVFGGLIVFSQQIVTGMTVWPARFVQYTKPISVIAVLTAGYYVIGTRAPRLWTGIMSGILILSGVVGLQTFRTTPASLELFRNAQVGEPLYAWLNANAPKDCVVYVRERGERTTRHIPVFTGCNVYASPYVSSGISEERIRHNLFAFLRSEGVTVQTFSAYLNEHPDLIKGYFFSDLRDVLTPAVNIEWLNGKIHELEPGYRAFLANDFATELKKYRIDYVFIEGADSIEGVRDVPVSRLVGAMGGGALFEPK